MYPYIVYLYILNKYIYIIYIYIYIYKHNTYYIYNLYTLRTSIYTSHNTYSILLYKYVIIYVVSSYMVDGHDSGTDIDWSYLP